MSIHDEYGTIRERIQAAVSQIDLGNLLDRGMAMWQGDDDDFDDDDFDDDDFDDDDEDFGGSWGDAWSPGISAELLATEMSYGAMKKSRGAKRSGRRGKKSAEELQSIYKAKGAKEGHTRAKTLTGDVVQVADPVLQGATLATFGALNRDNILTMAEIKDEIRAGRILSLLERAEDVVAEEDFNSTHPDYRKAMKFGERIHKITAKIEDAGGSPHGVFDANQMDRISALLDRLAMDEEDMAEPTVEEEEIVAEESPMPQARKSGIKGSGGYYYSFPWEGLLAVKIDHDPKGRATGLVLIPDKPNPWAMTWDFELAESWEDVKEEAEEQGITISPQQVQYVAIVTDIANRHGWNSVPPAVRDVMHFMGVAPKMSGYGALKAPPAVSLPALVNRAHRAIALSQDTSSLFFRTLARFRVARIRATVRMLRDQGKSIRRILGPQGFNKYSKVMFWANHGGKGPSHPRAVAWARKFGHRVRPKPGAHTKTNLAPKHANAYHAKNNTGPGKDARQHVFQQGGKGVKTHMASQRRSSMRGYGGLLSDIKERRELAKEQRGDRQELRQDQRSDRQEGRQDRRSDRQEGRQEKLSNLKGKLTGAASSAVDAAKNLANQLKSEAPPSEPAAKSLHDLAMEALVMVQSGQEAQARAMLVTQSLPKAKAIRAQGKKPSQMTRRMNKWAKSNESWAQHAKKNQKRRSKMGSLHDGRGNLSHPVVSYGMLDDALGDEDHPLLDESQLAGEIAYGYDPFTAPQIDPLGDIDHPDLDRAQLRGELGVQSLSGRRVGGRGG